MRQIGTITNERQLDQLTDFLLTLGIRIQVEPEASGFAVWALDEDRVAQARDELNRFVQNPDDERYAAAAREADRLRDELIQKEKARKKNVVDVRGQWTVPRAKPVTILLVLISCAVAFGNGFGEQRDDSITQALLMASEDVNGMYHKVFRPGSDVLRGQIWRLITPIFLHFGPMHLIMNMMALHSLGTLIEMRRGSWRLALMVLAIALPSNVAQYAYEGASFGGMSGVVFGLFGYAWMKSEFDPGSGIVITSTSVALMLGWLVLGMTGLMTNIIGPMANAAHFVGLIVGILLGYGPVISRRFLGW
jgi:GlpG protein